jgi:long-chain fatty acid transport protein
MAEFGNGGSSLTQENWRDTWSVALGADYSVTDKLTLRAGTAWDQTPVTDADRTPRIPDSSRYWLSVGATWKPIDHLALSVAYAHLFADDPKVNQVDQGPGTANFLRGNLLAAYEANVNIVAVQATLAF